MTEIEKKAMVHGFFEELEQIEQHQTMDVYARRFFSKVASLGYYRTPAVIGAVGGGVTGALSGAMNPGTDEYGRRRSRIGQAVKRGLSNAAIGAIAAPIAHAAGTGGMPAVKELGRDVVDAVRSKAQQVAKKKIARALTSKTRNKLGDSAFVFPGERRYPIHDKAHARNALARASGKPEEARVRAAVHAKYPGIGKEAGLKKVVLAINTKAIPHWVRPVAAHAAGGALPGAAVGALTAEKGERRRGALKGAVAGAATGAAAGHLYLRGKRDIGAAEHAAKRAGFGIKDFGKQDPKTKEKFHRLTHFYKRQTPIYPMDKAADAHDWDEERPSFVSRHKKKLVAGGLALATAGGIGAALLRKKKLTAASAPKPPTSVPPTHQAPPPPERRVQPPKVVGTPKKHTPEPPRGKRVSPADVEAMQDNRKARRRKKFEQPNERPRQYHGNEEHDFED